MTFTMLPVDSAITQPFGQNPTRDLPASHPTIQAYGNYQPWGHDGIDYGCWTGTPVRVPGDATVAYSGWGENMPYDVCIRYGFTTDQSAKWASGLIVILDHPTGISSYYAHLSRTDFDHMVGQRVKAGTILGLSGNTGRSGGDHLHQSAIRMPVNYSDGLYSRVNPLDYVTTVNTIPIAPGNTGAPSTAEEDDMALTNEDIDKIADRVLNKVVKDKKGQGQNSLTWFLTSQRASRDETRKQMNDAIKGAVTSILAAITAARK